MNSSKLIYRDSQGRELTAGDLSEVTGTVTWITEGDRGISKNARTLHQQARAAGGKGDYRKALELLSDASREEPEWPYPVYDAAYTYLLMGDADKSLERYQAVVRLAPRGFFTALTAVDTLLREKRGSLPPGTYRQFLELEWIQDPIKKKRALESMIVKAPGFAPAYKELALLTQDLAAALQLIDKGLKLSPDRETHGFLLVNKALILNRQGRHPESVKILGELILNPETPPDVEQIARASLKRVAK